MVSLLLSLSAVTNGSKVNKCDLIVICLDKIRHIIPHYYGKVTNIINVQPFLKQFSLKIISNQGGR